MQRRAPLSSALGAESTRTPSPHFSAGRRVHRDARLPHPPFQRRAPSGRRIHKTPKPAISARGASPAQMGRDPAPPLKRRPESARTPTPPHFSVGRFTGPDQQGPPPFLQRGAPSGLRVHKTRPPFSSGSSRPRSAGTFRDAAPPTRCARTAERRRPCGWSRVALGIRGFTGHLSLRRSDVKGGLSDGLGAGVPPICRGRLPEGAVLSVLPLGLLAIWK